MHACLPNSCRLDDGMCKCNEGLMRHPTTLICDWYCPSGFRADEYRYCVKQEEHLLELIFTSEQETEYCHQPNTIPDRGAYFDGAQSSFFVDDFEIYREFTVSLWACVNKNNATLVSMRDVPLWSGFDALRWHKNTNRWSMSDHEGYIEL
jgi:hypothetical protein